MSEGIEKLMPGSDFIKENYSGLIDVETVMVGRLKEGVVK